MTSPENTTITILKLSFDDALLEQRQMENCFRYCGSEPEPLDYSDFLASYLSWQQKLTDPFNTEDKRPDVGGRWRGFCFCPAWERYMYYPPRFL